MTDRRLPIYLLIDCSESMVGPAIDAVTVGLDALVGELKGDPFSLETAFLSVITFSRLAEQVVPLVELARFERPALRLRPGTSLGAAFALLGDCLGRELIRSSATVKGDYRPLVFLLTDGQPTDDWRAGFEALRGGGGPRFANLYAIGCGPDVDAAVLREVADAVLTMPDATPVQFKRLFIWLSASIQSVSQSIGIRDAADAVAPVPPELRAGPGADRPLDPGRLLLLRSRCSRTAEPYLMRFARQAPGGRYEAIAAYAADEVGPDDLAPLPALGADAIEGIPRCPFCANASVGACVCGRLFCASPGDAEATCPSCKRRVKLAGGAGAPLVRPSEG